MKLKEKNKYLLYSLLWLSFGSFLLHRDSKIYKENLESIEVTLEENPRFSNGKNPHLWIITEEYYKKFAVVGMTVRAMDKDRFTRQIKKGDKVILYIEKKDKAYLKYNTIINNYNIVFGIEKDLINYIDLDLRNLKQKKDERYLFGTIVLGIISFVYFILSDKLKLDYTKVMLVAGVLSMIVITIWNSF